MLWRYLGAMIKVSHPLAFTGGDLRYRGRAPGHQQKAFRAELPLLWSRNSVCGNSCSWGLSGSTCPSLRASALWVSDLPRQPSLTALWSLHLSLPLVAFLWFNHDWKVTPQKGRFRSSSMESMMRSVVRDTSVGCCVTLARWEKLPLCIPFLNPQLPSMAPP